MDDLVTKVAAYVNQLLDFQLSAAACAISVPS